MECIGGVGAAYSSHTKVGLLLYVKSLMESFEDFDVRGGGRAPKLQTIGPNGF
jgi:hypothetical protein